MSSTQEGSSGAATASKKAERNHRSWLPEEEMTLISSLKELVACGWKSDNGFRAGYLGRLEVAMRKEFPQTDLKALPHINSKISSWKKSYASLSAMLSRSGVGFNLRGNYMIECEDDQWEQIKKADPNARLMRFKQWRHYDDWKELFGKDRATGEMAEDIHEACADLAGNAAGNHQDGDGVDTEFSFESDPCQNAYDAVSQSARDGQQPRSAGKKWKVNTDLAGMCELLADMNHSTNERLQHLANRIGYEFDMGKARQETFDQLGDIPGLSL